MSMNDYSYLEECGYLTPRVIAMALDRLDLRIDKLKDGLVELERVTDCQRKMIEKLQQDKAAPVQTTYKYQDGCCDMCQWQIGATEMRYVYTLPRSGNLVTLCKECVGMVNKPRATESRRVFANAIHWLDKIDLYGGGYSETNRVAIMDTITELRMLLKEK
jgi:hypothetical protein